MTQIISTLHKLIKFQSTQDRPQQKLKCLQLLEKLFSKDFLVARYNFRGRPILVLSNTKNKKVDFILAGHIDVIPGKKNDFQLIAKGNRLYGRGVSDMKGPLTAAIFAIRDYLRNNNKLKVAMFVTSDEEVDGLSTKYLLEKRKYRASFAILPDGGNNLKIINQQKGFLQAKISIAGKSAHAARPWKATHPFVLALLLYQTLAKEFPMPKNENDWKTSVSLTKIEGGEALNQIPACLNLYFDVRYTRQEDRSRFFKVIKGTLETKYKIETLAENALLITKNNSPYIKALEKSIEKITCKRAQIAKECGTSDAIFFVESGISTVLLKPKAGKEHQKGEWLDRSSLLAFYEIILDFLRDFPSERRRFD